MPLAAAAAGVSAGRSLQPIPQPQGGSNGTAACPQLWPEPELAAILVTLG